MASDKPTQSPKLQYGSKKRLRPTSEVTRGATELAIKYSHGIENTSIFNSISPSLMENHNLGTTFNIRSFIKCAALTMRDGISLNKRETMKRFEASMVSVSERLKMIEIS